METRHPVPRIDRSSPIPLYAQLKHILREHIQHGSYQPGDRIPSELELCDHYGVSRIVVRQALAELTQEGLIVRRQGLGSFVAQPKIQESLVQKLTGFFQDMQQQGYTPQTTVLRKEKIRASSRVAANLGLEDEAEVIRIDRLRAVDDVPINYVSTYLPARLCPALLDADLSSQSLYGYLEETCQLKIDRGQRFIEAVPAGEYEANLLGIEPGSPLLQLESISYLSDGTPLEYYLALHRGDRSRFNVQLVRAAENSPRASELQRAGIDLNAGTRLLKTDTSASSS